MTSRLQCFHRCVFWYGHVIPVDTNTFPLFGTLVCRNFHFRVCSACSDDFGHVFRLFSTFYMSMHTIDKSTAFSRPSALPLHHISVPTGEFGIFSLFGGILMIFRVLAVVFVPFLMLCTFLHIIDASAQFPRLSTLLACAPCPCANWRVRWFLLVWGSPGVSFCSRFHVNFNALCMHECTQCIHAMSGPSWLLWA